MSLSKDELDRIARKAEKDLNSHQAKVGAGSRGGDDEGGVNTDIGTRFPGADVTFNTAGAGDKRRIPVEEGGEVDAKGRTARASQYEGEGGPADKAASARRANPGLDDVDVDADFASSAGEGRGRQAPPAPAAGGGARVGRGGLLRDPLAEGEDAARANLSGGTGRDRFKGDDYYLPESVPDSTSAEGNLPPESVIQASGETEGYDRA